MTFDLMLVVAPVFVLIVLGHVLRRNGIPSIEFWNLNDKLVYWVLFPALLFSTTSTFRLSGDLVFNYFLVIYTGFACAVIFALITGLAFAFPNPLKTSLIQGSARHNTFIALAVSERLFPASGLEQATLIVALLVPLTNITVVTAMVALLQSETSDNVARAIGRELLRNPLIVAIAAGLAVNFSGIGPLPVINDVTAILGAAALPIVLLCVGANIRVREMAVSALPTTLALIGKQIVFPLGIALAALAIGMPREQALIAMVFGAVPTAAASFTLARAMGGDAKAMAAIVTIQTAVAALTLPLTIMLAGSVVFPG